MSIQFFVVSHRFDLIENFMIRCCSLWKNNLNEDIFQSVICPKNIAVIPLSKNEAWYHFGQFIIMLLNEELLASSAFYLQCIKVLKQINHKVRFANNFTLNNFQSFHRKGYGTYQVVFVTLLRTL